MILCYHKISLEAKTHWWVTADKFREQMFALKQLRVVHLDEYDPSAKDNIVITFDGAYENVYQFAFPILKEFNYPFELFIIGKYIGKGNEFDEREPFSKFCCLNQLQEMAKFGGRIQYHSWSHTRFSHTNQLEQEALKTEIIAPQTLTNEFGPENFRWFAYPHGDYDLKTESLVKKYYSGALSVTQGSNDRYSLSRIEITENHTFKIPKVSIIVPNYNYGRFIDECLTSIANQSIPPYEVLISDDCSTDNSRDIISTAIKNYKGLNIKTNFNRENMGIVQHFNHATKLVSGDLISFIGADNRIRFDFIEKCLTEFFKNPSIGITSTDMMIFGPKSYSLSNSVGAKLFHQSVIEGYGYYYWKFINSELTLQDLRKRNSIHGSSMFKRVAYDQVNGYQQSNLPEDHYFFLRVIEKGWKLAHVQHPVLEYRQHSNAQANTVLNLQSENIRLKKLLLIYANEIERLKSIKK